METPEQMQERWKKAIADAGAQTEEQMRDSEVPTPSSPFELASYVQALVERPHDYGTCCYAMSMAAYAAFQYVASKLGVTGFQASCADMDFLKRSRLMKHGFLILDADQVLYPQYDLVGKAREYVERMKIELAGEAKKMLDENPDAHPNVIAHWKALANGES